MLAPEVVLLRREAAGEAVANWVVKREKTVFQASQALWQCGRVTVIRGPTAWASLSSCLRVAGVGKGVLTLPTSLPELTFLRFVPSGWG